MNSEEIKTRILELTTLLNELEQEPSTFEDIIFKKYVELESLPKVLNYLNINDMKKPEGTKYTTNDLSRIIQSCPSTVHPVILRTAQNIFSKNKKAVMKVWG